MHLRIILFMEISCNWIKFARTFSDILELALSLKVESTHIFSAPKRYKVTPIFRAFSFQLEFESVEYSWCYGFLKEGHFFLLTLSNRFQNEEF